MPYCRECRRYDHFTRDHGWWAIDRAVDPVKRETGLVGAQGRSDRQKSAYLDAHYRWQANNREYLNAYMRSYWKNVRQRRKEGLTGGHADVSILRRRVRSGKRKIADEMLSGTGVPDPA